MTKFGWALALASTAAALALATPLEAQGCTDAWVTQTIREVYQRAPNGSGNSGECDVNRYGGGKWNSYDQLKRYVNYQYMCQDPWIAQAVYDAHGRMPRGSGTSGECNPYLYGANWSGYPDLKNRVQGSINTLQAQSITFSNSGSLVSGGVALTAARLIGPDGGTLIGLDGAGVISRDGAGLIGNDGATLRRYGLQSTSRKIKLPGGSTLIIP